jgi:hypothetical protein
MNPKEVDFGDMISAVIESNAAKEKAEREARQAQAEIANAAKMEAIRPLLTVLKQARERFPRASIFTESSTPHFYMSGNAHVDIEFDPNTGEIRLTQREAGRGYHIPNKDHGSSFHAEDLIPPLVALLAKAVLRK